MSSTLTRLAEGLGTIDRARSASRVARLSHHDPGSPGKLGHALSGSRLSGDDADFPRNVP